MSFTFPIQHVNFVKKVTISSFHLVLRRLSILWNIFWYACLLFFCYRVRSSIMYSSGYPSFSSLPVLLFLPEAHVYPANCRGLQHWRQWSFPSYIRRKMISTATAATSATSLDTLAQLRRAGSCEQTRSQLLKWLLFFCTLNVRDVLYNGPSIFACSAINMI